jgi:hypothetical protein
VLRNAGTIDFDPRLVTAWSLQANRPYTDHW